MTIAPSTKPQAYEGLNQMFVEKKNKSRNQRRCKEYDGWSSETDTDKEGKNQRKMSKVNSAMWKSMKGARMAHERGSWSKIKGV